MKDKGPKAFKLVKTNSALDFLKSNTSLASTLEGINNNNNNNNNLFPNK